MTSVGRVDSDGTSKHDWKGECSPSQKSGAQLNGIGGPQNASEINAKKPIARAKMDCGFCGSHSNRIDPDLAISVQVSICDAGGHT
jgi:hypothetical protein